MPLRRTSDIDIIIIIDIDEIKKMLDLDVAYLDLRYICRDIKLKHKHETKHISWYLYSPAYSIAYIAALG